MERLQRWMWLTTPYGQEYLVYSTYSGHFYAHGEMKPIKWMSDAICFITYAEPILLHSEDFLIGDKLEIIC